MNSKRIFSTLLALLVTSFAAHAFKLTPAVISITPSQDGASAVVRVENNSDERAAIQFSILTREMDINGREKSVPVEDAFMVYPPQAIIEPRKTQTVRIRWIGESLPKEEIAYRFLAEQLPINLTKGDDANVNLNIVVRILGSLYIRPDNTSPDIRVESVLPTTDPSGRKMLAIQVANEGSAHAILGHLSIKFHSKSPDGTQISEVELLEDSLHGFNSENVLRGTKRRFVIPWPEGLLEGELSAQLDFDPQI